MRMRVPFLANVIDERFLTHRLRSTSYMGMAGAVTSLGLFLYRHYANNVWNWDLFAVGATMALTKLAFMTWYRLTD